MTTPNQTPPTTDTKPTNGAKTAQPTDSNGKNVLDARWSEFDRWLRPEYVNDKSFTLTITDITIEEGWLKGKLVKCRALHFKQVPNMLALSPPNERTLAALFGNKLGNAVGKDITLKKTPMLVAKQQQTPLRIQRNAVTTGTESNDPQYVPLEEFDPESNDNLEGEIE